MVTLKWFVNRDTLFPLEPGRRTIAGGANCSGGSIRIGMTRGGISGGGGGRRRSCGCDGDFICDLYCVSMQLLGQDQRRQLPYKTIPFKYTMYVMKKTRRQQCYNHTHLRCFCAKCQKDQYGKKQWFL